MKRFFLGMLAIAAMVATSCQKDVNIAGGDTVDVVFNVGAPEMRSFSDGMTATVLQYAVYEQDGTYLETHTKSVANGNAATINISTTVTVRLTTGNNYSIIFWAAAPNAPYAIDFADKKMTVNYENAKCNDEARDAFFAKVDFTAKKGLQVSADLKRPFAQLNIGSNDFEASANAGHVVSHSKVVIPAYKNLNLWSGAVDGLENRTFGYEAVPTAETFPLADFDYLAMTYVLMAKDEEVVDLTFYYATGADGANEKSRSVGSVPVKRNHRTNLYGSIFTNEIIGNVEIKPGYEDDYNKEIPVVEEENI